MAKGTVRKDTQVRGQGGQHHDRGVVQDIGSHSGGLWKMADTIRGLGSRTARAGTYDYNLEYIVT